MHPQGKDIAKKLVGSKASIFSVISENFVTISNISGTQDIDIANCDHSHVHVYLISKLGSKTGKK